MVVLSRISSGVTEFINEQQEAGRPCELHEIELADADACRTAFDAIHSRHGRIDVLLNNARFNDGVSLSQGDSNAFLRSLQNNLFPAFVLPHAALPALKTARGCVVNIGSKVALAGQGGTSDYEASKGGLLALTILHSRSAQATSLNSHASGEYYTERRPGQQRLWDEKLLLSKRLMPVCFPLYFGNEDNRFSMKHRSPGGW